MNVAEARQLTDGSGWHWTTNGVPSQPCRQHVGDESDPMWYLKPSTAADWKLCEPHATKEDAERHYWEWSLGRTRENSYTSAHKCEVCGEWTNRTIETPFYPSFVMSWLCDAHRTAAQFRELHPFEAGITLWYS